MGRPNRPHASLPMSSWSKDTRGMCLWSYTLYIFNMYTLYRSLLSLPDLRSPKSCPICSHAGAVKIDTRGRSRRLTVVEILSTPKWGKQKCHGLQSTRPSRNLGHRSTSVPRYPSTATLSSTRHGHHSGVELSLIASLVWSTRNCNPTSSPPARLPDPISYASSTRMLEVPLHRRHRSRKSSQLKLARFFRLRLGLG